MKRSLRKKNNNQLKAGLQKINEDTNVFQSSVIHTSRQIILRVDDLVTIAVPPILPTIMNSLIQFDLT
ncbi:MAG: hypothetical protein EZS28_014360 [Streblomastix strix]|uniref:Uncharacterized protein n=1 Tax=Streblomastix strix TaxID=222440 RepID=A0A5J4W5A2_9EUKA|nr:MAG: hypothetical protein EZS28_014360 [Streblomastix strix]